MKKILAIALAFALAALPLYATTNLLNGVTATGASAWFDNQNNRMAYVHIWSGSGSTATVKIEIANGTDEPAVPMATITNPDGTGEVWIGNGRFIRVEVATYVSGTIYATIQEQK